MNSSILSITQFENSEKFARDMDAKDAIANLRNEFYIPKTTKGEPCIYFAGNSLGLQPKKAKQYIEQELNDWAELGVEGHFDAKFPWLPYHENLTAFTARLVGAKEHEVIVMNSLTVNLHLMMVSFYKPNAKRYKILMEKSAFPSDQYALASQAQFHGFNSKEAIIEIGPRVNEMLIRHEDILELIEKQGEQIALVLLGNVNYLTGQALDMKLIAEAAHKKGCLIGFDLAHGAGNLLLNLHDSQIDFAVWCSYKYLNAGPGAIAGCFVHEKHANQFDLPRFAGWWGHNKNTRFKMDSKFDPMYGAEGWQLSNPPIFQLAALRASMELFDSVGMKKLREKGDMLTAYLQFVLESIPNKYCTLITPSKSCERGSQLSVRIKDDPKKILTKLKEAGALCDFREPDILRASPVPSYNSFMDIFKFGQLLSDIARS
jgi:kynureninase